MRAPTPMCAERGRTVVVVTHQHAAEIPRCLAALRGERVVLVDNASTDATADVVAAGFPWVELVRSPRNRGFAAGVNLGLARAGRDDVVLVNPDAVVGPDTLDRLAQVLEEHPTVGVVAPRLRNPDGSVQESARSFKTVPSLLARRTPLGRLRWGRAVLARHLGPSAADEPTEVDWALGALLVVRRAALDEVGPLDERFFLYEEDVDWCLRMWQAGWGVLYVPAVEVEHGYRRASRHTWDLRRPATRHHWASVLRLTLKHPGVVLLARRPTPGSSST